VDNVYPSHNDQQSKEIETIRKRTIELELSDADVKRLTELAGSHGLTVGKLLENFIGDLVCGTYSNGSDERDLAEQWFERCWFGMFPDMTFLHYLIELGRLDEVIEAYDDMIDSEESIKNTQKELASGVIVDRGGETYTWQDIVKRDNSPYYASLEEWEAKQRSYIELEQDIICNCRETLSDYWNEYTAQEKEYKSGTFDEEMKKVLEWRQEYERLLASGGPEQTKESGQHEDDKTGV